MIFEALEKECPFGKQKCDVKLWVQTKYTKHCLPNSRGEVLVNPWQDILKPNVTWDILGWENYKDSTPVTSGHLQLIANHGYFSVIPIYPSSALRNSAGFS